MLPDPITLTVSSGPHVPPTGTNASFARTPGGFVSSSAPYSADEPAIVVVKNASKIGVRANFTVDSRRYKNVAPVAGISQSDAVGFFKITCDAPLQSFTQNDIQQMANHAFQVFQAYVAQLMTNQS